MKFKSVEYFTLQECEEYVKMNPKGSEAVAVMDRMRSLLAQREHRLTFDVNGVNFVLIAVAGGTFQMGEQYKWYQFSKKNKLHTVTLDDYYIGEIPVTQELWLAVMGKNPSYFNNSKCPVEQVTLVDCQCFVDELNIMLENQRPNKRKFRLPTEAEWEYAARGGNKSNGCVYSGSHSIDKVGWYNGNSDDKTHPVKGKNPNELGLYDMSGNVWEWCCDNYASYPKTAQTNPKVENRSCKYVRRGGSYCCVGCRVDERFWSWNGASCIDLGLRLAL